MSREGSDQHKIGISLNPELRVKFYYTSYAGARTRLEWSIDVPCMRCAELGAHKSLKAKKHRQSEWFSASLLECMDAVIQEAIGQASVKAFLQGSAYSHRYTLDPFGPQSSEAELTVS
jgi:hypothetical protein